MMGNCLHQYYIDMSFCYLGDTLDGDGGAELATTARIRYGWMKFREILPFLTSRAPPLEMKGRVYASCGRSSRTYESETRTLLADVGLKFERAEMQMIKLMCGVSMKDRRRSEEWLQTTHPTNGVAVTAVTNCCANCVKTSCHLLQYYKHRVF